MCTLPTEEIFFIYNSKMYQGILMKLYAKAQNFLTKILVVEWNQLTTSVHDIISSEINTEFTNHKLWLKLIASLYLRLNIRYFSEFCSNESPWQVEQWISFFSFNHTISNQTLLCKINVSHMAMSSIITIFLETVLM